MGNRNRDVSEDMVGRIHSVYCKDFVSYNEITFYPKKYLNVLTGPNGTGKSTIVSAIILGLGGDPNLLDRSSSVADYIKSGRTTAIIIIKIYGKGSNDAEAFRRVINQNGSSSFAINNKEMSKKLFLGAVASYNIQVSNLCQFLPQDRVQDFSRMNPQELLINTMSSVCNDELTRSFNQLKEMRIKQSSAHTDRNKEINNLQKKQKRLEQLQMSVAQYQEREEIIKKLNIYNAKKNWIEIKAAERKAAEYNKELEKAKIHYEEMKKKHEFQLRAQTEILKKKSELREKCLDKTRLLTQATAAKGALETQLETLKHEIYESKCILERNIQLSSKNAVDVEKLMHLVDTKKHELNEFSKNKSNVLSELEQHKEKISTIRKTAMDQYNKRRELETTLNDDKIPEITALRHKLDRLQNVKKQRLEELSHKNPNLVKAMNWVEQNKHKYKMNIYDPMVFELTMESDDGAKYLENVVRPRDLYAFACEDKSDMSDLINELCVKQKLAVNVIYCPPTDRCLYNSTIKITDLRKLGFHAYLLDLVSGPVPIINKLCASYHIHNIPIGGDEVNNFATLIPKSIRVYFGGNKKFSVMTSRYRSDPILTESTIRGKNQLISLDSKQLESLQKRYNEAMSEQDSIKNNLGKADREFERLQQILREEGEKKRKVDQKISHFSNLANEVETLLKKAQTLKQSFTSMDTLKNNYLGSVLTKMRKISETETKIINNLETLETLLLEKKVAQAMETVYKLQHETQEDALKESEEGQRKAKSVINQLLDNSEVLKREIETTILKVKRLCNDKLPVNEDFPFKSEFKSIAKLNVEQLHEAINDLKARLECMKNVNAETIASFQQLQSEVEQCKEIIEKSSNQEMTFENQICAIYNKWEPELRNLIETINTKFSDFMESIEYLGEVVLYKTDKYDFDSYGIQIMVQYRKDAQLQNLDKFIQSGGERAVAIAIYSLSLQHVTHVPFRCVDEINQGMDAKNERNIFDLLLKAATKPGSAQYIFVTPKLLHDLNYNEHLCVSVVHNSRTTLSGTTFPLT